MDWMWVCVVCFRSYVIADILRDPPNLFNNFDPRFGAVQHQTPRSYFPHGMPPGQNPGYNSPDFHEERAQPYELYDLEEKLTRAGKWPEFLAKLKEQGDKIEPGKIMPNWEEDVYKWAAYAKSLNDPMKASSLVTERPIVRLAEPKERPSLGMEMYWSQEDKDTTQVKQIPKSSGPNVPQYVSGQGMMDMALRKIEHMENQQSQNIPPSRGPRQNVPPPNISGPPAKLPPPPQSQVPETDLMKMMMKKIEHLEYQLKEREPSKILPGFPTETHNPMMENENLLNENSNMEAFKNLPTVDDYNSPIRWVKFNSNETEDGLAKVTDPETYKNRQYVINGIYYVPVIDYSLERLGMTTKPTTQAPVLTTEGSILRTVMKNVDLKTADQRDWLAFETVIGGDRNDLVCDGDGCQSRCRKMGCETMCEGDTCASGCVGIACNSYCKGPGCLSMCIGEKCSARCDGLSCDARCRGSNCDATCTSFSCYKTVNGVFQRGGGSFDQFYPQ